MPQNFRKYFLYTKYISSVFLLFPTNFSMLEIIMELQNELQDIAHEWELKLEGEPKISATGLIATACQNGVPRVLKLFASESDEKLSAMILSLYNGHNAVKVIQKSEHALLLERAIPGTHLKSLSLEGRDDEAMRIFCDVVKGLHSKTDIPAGIPTIADFWEKGFDRYLHSGDTQIAAPLAQKAKQIFFDLANSQGSPVLLHGDLHHDNILFDEKRGWLAIDPKGVIGEAEIEVAAFLKNPIGHPEIYANEKIIQNRISTISGELNLNKERVISWAFTLTILSAIWLTEVDEIPSDWLALAKKLENML